MYCERRGLDCDFAAEEGESRQQALKRKYDDLLTSNSALTELFHHLQTSTDSNIGMLVDSIRSGYDPPGALAKFKRRLPPEAIVRTNPRRSRSVMKLLLRTILECTGSMTEVREFSRRLDGRLPGKEATIVRELQPLRGRIVHSETIASLLHYIDAGEDRIDLDVPFGIKNAGYRLLLQIDQPLDVPVHRVPAKPWTNVTSDDRLVSHLVSIFIHQCNFYWRYVEEDLALRAMTAGDLASEFCSPFLVNAMCAMASVWQLHHEVVL